MVQAGLVLEGGGMKGIYTAGVLDFFMEKDLYFQNVYGVSAGACHLCSYISRQPKRAYMYHWITSEIRITAACAVC